MTLQKYTKLHGHKWYLAIKNSYNLSNGDSLLYTSDINNNRGIENILDPAGAIAASKRFDGNYANMYFFYNYDIRGSVTSILKPDGSLVKGYSYDEFGNTNETGEAQFKNDTKFTGAVHDTPAGLYYMNSRFYDPNTGRFLSQDTYSGNPYAPWTQHLYSYTSNNPVNFIDPTGHMMLSVTDDVAGTSVDDNLELSHANENTNINFWKELGKSFVPDNKQIAKVNATIVLAAVISIGELELENKTSQVFAKVKLNKEMVKPRSPGQFNTFHQFELDSDLYYASDSVQFRQANKSLIERLNTDTKFRKDMFTRKPELKTWLDSCPNLANSPTGFTWHHSEETGILKLVDRIDHSTNFSIYHPTGNGGRDIWGGGILGRIGKLDRYGNIKK